MLLVMNASRGTDDRQGALPGAPDRSLEGSRRKMPAQERFSCLPIGALVHRAA